MKTRHFLTLGGSAIAVALIAATAGIASAQEAAAGTGTNAAFQNLDKNQDGHLSRSEIPADMPLLRTRLSTYDTNQDGTLDPQEFATAQAALHDGGHAGGTEGAPPPRHSGG
jgi:EF hand